MTPAHDNPAAARRRLAEATVTAMNRPAQSHEDSEKTRHELLVHQVELEMQNEELRRLHIALEAERTRYFDLFDLAPIGYVTLNPDDLIVEANLTAADMVGRSRERLVKQPFSQLIHPLDQDVFHLMREQLRENHTPQTCELRLRKTDKTLLWARLEATMSDTEATESHCRLTISDATETILAREALARREQEYRLLAENASDVVFRCNEAGLIEWITPSVTLRGGWTPKQLVGSRFADLVHPDDSNRLLAAQASLRDGTGFNLELRIRIQSDGYRWFAVSIHPALDDAGRVTHLVGGWQDIQNEVQARAALEAERARLQATLDSLLDPHVTLEAVRDPQGQITDFVFTEANEAACRYNQLDREHLVGMRVLELLPAHMSSGLLNLYRQALESAQPLVLNDFVYPHELYGEERRFDIRAVKVGDALSFTWRDVTERYQMSRQLAASEEHYRLITENSYDTTIRVSDDGTILWVSPSLRALIGWAPEEWIGQTVTRFLTPTSAASLTASLRRSVAGEPIIARYEVLAKDGCPHWAESRAMPYLDAHGHRDGTVAAFHLIDEQVAMEQELERRARTDELTNLLNRKEVFARIEALGGQHPRTGPSIAVLFCDIDNFKTINDTHGHAAGDEVLRVMADRIRHCLRSTDDLGARVGGDELLVVLHGVQDLDNAVAIAEKLRLSAAEPIAISGGRIRATLSIGVTLVTSGEDSNSLVARSDAAMYHAKQAGRNYVVALAPPEKN